MNLDLSGLNSIYFNEFLRFDLKYLDIFYNDKFRDIPKWDLKIRSLWSTTLEEILFDTGNQAGYAVIAGQYLSFFKSDFPSIEIIDKSPYYKITNSELTFRFNDIVIFKSKLLFRPDAPSDWLNQINFGMDSINQFISVIYPNHRIGINQFWCLQNDDQSL